MTEIYLSDEDMPELTSRCNCHTHYDNPARPNRNPQCPYCIAVPDKQYGIRPSPFGCKILNMLTLFQGKVKVL
jgi:hypothetical protein